MDSRRFDRLTKALGTHVSRRTALSAGAGMTGLALAGGQRQLAAQDATPAAEGEKLFFLFVQSFDGGSLAPKEGEDGTYVLTLQGAHGRTIAFSDRPDRVVVSVPTQQFLDGLGFSPANPPNAALVIEPAPGETDIIVIELLNPQYDEAAQTLTYDVTILDSFVSEQGLTFLEETRPPHADGEEFGHAQLFIDDCGDYDYCWTPDGPIGPIGPFGQCWSWDSFTCAPDNDPCNGHSIAYINALCNNTYPACGGACY